MNTNFDPDKLSTVLVDTSKFATCAILLQDEKIVACTSRTLNKHQRNWATIEREQFGISNACKKFRIYLLGHHFTMKTDHQPLIGLQKKVDSIENQRLLAMVLATTEFSFNLARIPSWEEKCSCQLWYATNPRHRLANSRRRSLRTEQSSSFQFLRSYSISQHWKTILFFRGFSWSNKFRLKSKGIWR